MTTFYNNKSLFAYTCKNQDKERMAKNIMRHIEDARMARLRWKTITYSLLTLGAFVAIKPATAMILSAANNSGFADFVYMAFSEGANLADAWSDLVFSIIETLPIYEIGILLAVILLSAFLLGNSLKSISKLRSYERLNA